ncbi:MAG: asparagine synthetase B [Lutibacter sp.]|nr:MAG: asparagine synthetase B [Lutibacter sp.]
MKKNVLVIAAFAIVLMFTNEMSAQKFADLDKSPMDGASYPSSYKVSDKLVKVIYSRPQLKGRAVSKLAPNDKVWRTGANEAAEITFYKDVMFGGKAVKSGTYTLFTIPSDGDWTVILSTAKNVWGSYFYKEGEDVVRVKGTVSKSEESIEAFSIAFDGEEMNAKMYLGWGNTIVTVPVKG